MPNEFRDAWKELQQSLLMAEEDWDVWLDWYKQRLAGGLASEEDQYPYVTLEEEIWHGSPKDVNSHIKDLVVLVGHLERVLGPDQKLPATDAIPQQVSTATRFAIDADGRLDVLPDPPTPDTAQNELYREVRYKALELSRLGHNQLAELSEPIARFVAAAPDQIASVSITRLWSRGNTLRRRLKAHDIAQVSAEPSDPAVVPGLVAEMLRDLIDTYNIFIVGDPTGRELDQVRLGPQERDTSNAISDAAAQIVEAVKASEGVATPAAIEALSEQSDAALNAPSNVDGDQAIDLSRKTTGNFVIELLRSAGANLSKGALGEVGKRAAAAASPFVVAFVAAHAHALRIFVEQAFNNPTLIQIIDLMTKISIGP
jgi:hypothetical protein